MVQGLTLKVSAVNICKLSCHSDLFLVQEKNVLFILTRWGQKLCHYHTVYLYNHWLSASASLLCTPVQNSCVLLLQIGCLHHCLIPTASLCIRVDWHVLPNVGLGQFLCSYVYLLNMGQGPSLHWLNHRTFPLIGPWTIFDYIEVFGPSDTSFCLNISLALLQLFLLPGDHPLFQVAAWNSLISSPSKSEWICNAGSLLSDRWCAFSKLLDYSGFTGSNCSSFEESGYLVPHLILNIFLPSFQAASQWHPHWGLLDLLLKEQLVPWALPLELSSFRVAGFLLQDWFSLLCTSTSYSPLLSSSSFSMSCSSTGRRYHDYFVFRMSGSSESIFSWNFVLHVSWSPPSCNIICGSGPLMRLHNFDWLPSHPSSTPFPLPSFALLTGPIALFEKCRKHFIHSSVQELVLGFLNCSKPSWHFVLPSWTESTACQPCLIPSINQPGSVGSNLSQHLLLEFCSWQFGRFLEAICKFLYGSIFLFPGSSASVFLRILIICSACLLICCSSVVWGANLCPSFLPVQ